jgi:hypothetical protein
MKKTLMAALAAFLFASGAQAESVGAHGGPGTTGCQKVEDGQWCAVAGCLKITRVMYLSEDAVTGQDRSASIRFNVANSCNAAVDFAYAIGFGGAPQVRDNATVEAKQTLRQEAAIRRPEGVKTPTLYLSIGPAVNSRDYDPKKTDDQQAAVSRAKLKLPLLPMRAK